MRLHLSDETCPPNQGCTLTEVYFSWKAYVCSVFMPHAFVLGGDTLYPRLAQGIPKDHK